MSYIKIKYIRLFSLWTLGVPPSVSSLIPYPTIMACEWHCQPNITARQIIYLIIGDLVVDKRWSLLSERKWSAIDPILTSSRSCSHIDDDSLTATQISRAHTYIHTPNVLKNTRWSHTQHTLFWLMSISASRLFLLHSTCSIIDPRWLIWKTPLTTKP